jgi:Cft2 family RNA processing exonuclease
MSDVRLTILGSAREIGASCHCMTLGGHSILLDAGLHPKRQGRAALPALEAAPEDVEEILISHAHLDHVGALPVALRTFPRSRVYMTEPTALLAVRMLRNAVAVARNRGAGQGPPLYNDEHVEWVEQVLHTARLGHPLSLQRAVGEAPRVTFLSAGHLLGAAGILVEHRGRRLFFTGDTCSSSQHICGPASYPPAPIDLLLMECTHGAEAALDQQAAFDEERDGPGFSRAKRDLASFISTVAERGGSVLLPVFALGRTQEILGVLQDLARQHAIPRLPIYISGLAHAICRIYDATRLDSERRHPELCLEDIGFRLLDPERREDPRLLDQPCLFVVTSGMMFPGTSSCALARRFLPDPKQGIAFVGFLDPESPGYRVACSTPGEKVDLQDQRAPLPVACEVKRFHFTAHSRAHQLIQMAEDLRPERIVLVHGELEASGALSAQLTRRGHHVIVAEERETIVL